jgi:hypothetical protein
MNLGSRKGVILSMSIPYYFNCPAVQLHPILSKCNEKVDARRINKIINYNNITYNFYK